MSAQPHPRLTPEQYLELERAAETRSEFYDGRMYAMSGGSLSHGRIILNFGTGLNITLRQRPCSVAVNDLRVRVTPEGLYTYPDIVVVCGEPKLADTHNDTLLNPTVLVEVLSPSTEAYDRGFKSSQYRNIESLREYALVWQTEARVEVYRRETGGWFLTEWIGLNSVCRFESLDCNLSLSEIYDKLTFPA